ncbi:MAG: DNA polymerase III delta subunit [uncultured Friedmanniella sp.]|uniref:DNA-directed DNA polymerase n=1 Tax=uncultured Friedmanniella sp. TaxID=335381 RepID=A0A6J4KY20_9ACTN|nr:DNA polymerase III subunit delta [uncultured Friedmanniella sp.]CAA9317992.1 MAG: DNA polymerase III delta subunit [uncultured Friedmanniella sp.]
MPSRPSNFGRVTLVSGPESLLSDRAVATLLAELRKESPEAELARADAERLDPAAFAEMTSASLFATRRVAVVENLADLPAELHEPVLDVARSPLEDLALVLVHGGGQKGKGLLDKLKAAKVQVLDAPAVKAWELPQFVTAEARRLGAGIDPGAAQTLVDAVGHDLRSLASAVSQLVSDGEGGPIEEVQVRRYFGGRSEVTSFAVADAALAGRTGVAMEQLRWALATGVVPVLITSALASGLRGLGKLVTAGSGLREADLAREVGVPPWKLKSMRSQARGWDQGGLATALQAVALADAEVKGAADDAAFALERAVLTVARARRG